VNLPNGISVVIPVYNCEATLGSLYERLVVVLETAARGAWEIMMVDDGSADGSWTIIRRLANADRRVVAMRMMRNYGQHNALVAGIRRARFATIVTIDDDLQHPPEVLPTLLAKFGEGWDIVGPLKNPSPLAVC